jgi:DNA-binding response OmpR family regulator
MGDTYASGPDIPAVVILERATGDRSLLAHHFRHLGFSVTQVGDAPALLDAVRSRPLVAVLQRDFGDVPTQDLIARLRAASAGCHVVVASQVEYAHVVPGQPGLHEIGADAVLDLPYTRSSVRRLVRRLIERGPARIEPAESVAAGE